LNNLAEDCQYCTVPDNKFARRLPITSDTFARGLPPLIYKGAITVKNVKVQLKNHKAKNIFLKTSRVIVLSPIYSMLSSMLP
jgi:hypothetical protein